MRQNPQTTTLRELAADMGYTAQPRSARFAWIQDDPELTPPRSEVPLTAFA